MSKDECLRGEERKSEGEKKTLKERSQSFKNARPKCTTVKLYKVIIGHGNSGFLDILSCLSHFLSPSVSFSSPHSSFLSSGYRVYWMASILSFCDPKSLNLLRRFIRDGRWQQLLLQKRECTQSWQWYSKEEGGSFEN